MFPGWAKRPRAVLSGEFANRLAGANLFLQPLAKRVGQGSQPLVERKFRRVLFGDTTFAFPLPRTEDLAKEKGAVALLQCVQLGERLAH